MPLIRRSFVNLALLNKQCVRLASVDTAIKNENLEAKPWHDIPGPSSLPIIGQLHHFLPGGSLYNLKETIFEKLFVEYGPITKLNGFFGNAPIIILSDAESAEHILRSENSLPIRIGLKSLDYFRRYYNNHNPDAPLGLLTDQGERWKKFRSTVNPIMLQPKTIKLYKKSLREVADDMVNSGDRTHNQSILQSHFMPLRHDWIKAIRNKKDMLQNNFDFEMNLWALESIGVIALGGRLNCLDLNLPEDSPAKELIHTVHDVLGISEKLDSKPSLWKYIATPEFKKAMKIYKKQVDLSKYFIEKSIEQFQKRDKSDSEERGILEKLLEIDEEVAIIMASDMLLAGVDTTSNTVTATLYLLASNVEKQNKLRQEINEEEEKRSYLKACIKESLRMMSVAPANTRTVNKDYNILGYNIPKNSQVVFAHQWMSNRAEYFPKSNEFIPERWITDKSDVLYHGNTHPFAYNPFGFGVRMCIGRRIAELEIETFIEKVIESFHVEWNGPPIKVKHGNLNYTIGPFHFVFKDVK